MSPSGLLLLVLAATGPQHAFEDWARERARAFEQGDRSIGKAPLWRERNGSGPFLVGFSAPSSLAPLVRAVSPGVINVLTYSAAGGGHLRRTRADGDRARASCSGRRATW